MRAHLLSLFCLLSTSLPLFGQGEDKYLVAHRRYSLEDGLVSRAVVCGTQDNDGFIWFGTRDGLNRFDGFHFKLFNKETNGLKNNKIAQLVCDQQNHLLVAYASTVSDKSINGVGVFDLNTYQIREFKDVYPNAPFEDDQVSWVGLSEGVVYFWLFSDRRWYLRDGKFEPVDGVTKNDIMRRALKEVWYDIYQAIGKQYSVGALEYHSFEPAVSEDSNEYAFFHPSFGLNLFQDGKCVQLIDSAAWKKYQGIEIINAFFRDRMDNIWFCTPNGVIKVTVKQNLFEQYFSQKEAKVYYNTNQVRGIYAFADGTVLANVWHHLFVSDGRDYEMGKWGAPLVYHLGKFYGGSDYIFEFDPLKEKFTRLYFPYYCETWSIFFVNDEEALFSTSIGLMRHNMVTGASTDTFPRPEWAPEPRVGYRAFRGRDQSIWAVCENGLFQFDEKCQSIVDYYGPLKNDLKHNKPFKNLFDAYEDSNGVFWIATSGDGLFLWDRKSNFSLHFTSEDGLPSNILYRIEEDDFGHLWISTDNGLVRFNKQDFCIKSYTTKDGLSNNEFNRISSFKGPDGRMYFGGLDGVNAFYPKNFAADTTYHLVPLRVIEYTQYNQSQDDMEDRTVELMRDHEIVIRPGDRFFNIEFGLLNYEEGNSKYSYIIEGYDSEWDYLPGNSLRVSGLPYGTFVLKVKGRSPNGEWSRHQLVFTIRVLKPLYLQWWFVVLGTVLALGSITFFFRWRTQKLFQDKQKLEQAVQLRTDQLSQMLVQKNLMMKEIHHRVKNNLQVISGLLELQHNRSKDPQTQDALLDSQNRVLSIAFIHQNLYQHDDLKGVEMQTFTTELSNHIHHLFSKDTCPVNIAVKVGELFLDIDTALPMGLIINELLTNSYKYAFAGLLAGKIEIELRQVSEGNYYFRYHDNGKGLPGDVNLKKVNTLGLRLITRLSKQLAGEMQYSYEKGSTFSLDFKNMEERNNM